MATLENKSPSEFYKDLLQTANSNTGIDNSSRMVQCGNGDKTAFEIGRNEVKVKPVVNSATAFEVQDSSGSSVFSVNTTTGRAMTGSVPVNSQVKEFNLSYGASIPSTANTWSAIPANQMAGIGTSLGELQFGTSSSATASVSLTANAHLYPAYWWYVPYDIDIFAIKTQTASDTANGDEFIYSVSKYDLNTGNTSSSGNLTNGTQIALSLAETSAGFEQVYYKDLVLDNAQVTGGQAVLAFIKQDGTNSDLSCNLQIFYTFV